MSGRRIEGWPAVKVYFPPNDMSKYTYERRKQEGLCTRCGKVLTNDKKMCEECLEKEKVKTRETREFYKSLGLCPRCGRNKLFGSEKQCPECSAKMYESNRKSREKRNLNLKEYYKKDIKELKENGLCRSCRKRKVAEGHTYCPICLAKHREYGRKRRMVNSKSGIGRSERPNYGLCYFCGEKIDTDGRTCSRCAEIMKRNLPEKSMGNLYWRMDNKLIKKKSEVLK